MEREKVRCYCDYLGMKNGGIDDIKERRRLLVVRISSNRKTNNEKPD